MYVCLLVYIFLIVITVTHVDGRLRGSEDVTKSIELDYSKENRTLWRIIVGFVT